MFWNLFYTENIKIFRRKIVWVEILLLALMVIAANTLLYITTRSDLGRQSALPPAAREQFLESLVWPGSLVNSLGFATSGGLGGLLVVVLVGSLLGQEYAWRNFHLLLSRGASRPAVLMAKIASLILPMTLIVLTALVAGGLITAIFSFEVQGGLNLEQLNVVQLLWSVFRSALTLLPYAALTFLLAVATRSQAAAIGIGLAYAFLVESILGQILGMMGDIYAQVWTYLPAGLSNAVLQLNQAADRSGMITGNGAASPDLLAPLPAAIGLILWTLLFAGMALLVFQRQDLTE
jgi:ABC-2 type transport system permease protein